MIFNGRYGCCCNKYVNILSWIILLSLVKWETLKVHIQPTFTLTSLFLILEFPISATHNVVAGKDTYIHYFVDASLDSLRYPYMVVN